MGGSDTGEGMKLYKVEETDAPHLSVLEVTRQTEKMYYFTQERGQWRKQMVKSEAARDGYYETEAEAWQHFEAVMIKKLEYTALNLQRMTDRLKAVPVEYRKKGK